ncbi:hypothetical protein PJ985_09590 [Streptomyces sp. ACA25]|uniref:hypothetical protein n=1 Tax=Streptomyces sp. ACA25 TaxID=3022596 RepID=UPI002307A4DA|nr:hypothetical protein [Streptomyces sp. ACA25]MDB1087815.1 hypothetical protein [Streptomyces sp. ACA25]
MAAFWLTTSSVGAIGDERHELVAATQEHVGHLLGLASHSSSDEMNSAPHNPGLKTKPLRTAQS